MAPARGRQARLRSEANEAASGVAVCRLKGCFYLPKNQTPWCHDARRGLVLRLALTTYAGGAASSVPESKNSFQTRAATMAPRMGATRKSQ